MSSKLSKKTHNFINNVLENLYTSFAFAYDSVAWLASIGRWQNWVKSITPYIHGEKILELGVGPGHLFSSLHHPQAIVVGIDKSRSMIRLAKKNSSGGSKNCTPSLSFLVMADAKFLPFSTNTFDTVYSTFPTDFITQEKTLHNTYRLLKQEGILIVLLAAYPTGVSFVSRLLGIIYRITGQSVRAESQLLTKIEHLFGEHGFATNIRWEDKFQARLLFILARKMHISEID